MDEVADPSLTEEAIEVRGADFDASDISSMGEPNSDPFAFAKTRERLRAHGKPKEQADAEAELGTLTCIVCGEPLIREDYYLADGRRKVLHDACKGRCTQEMYVRAAKQKVRSNSAPSNNRCDLDNCPNLVPWEREVYGTCSPRCQKLVAQQRYRARKADALEEPEPKRRRAESPTQAVPPSSRVQQAFDSGNLYIHLGKNAYPIRKADAPRWEGGDPRAMVLEITPGAFYSESPGIVMNAASIEHIRCVIYATRAMMDQLVNIIDMAIKDRI
jgi:hypothetical protein